MITLDTTNSAATLTTPMVINVTTQGVNRLVVLSIGWLGNTTAISVAPTAVGLTFTRVTAVNAGILGRMEVWMAYATLQQSSNPITITIPGLLLSIATVICDTYLSANLAVPINSSAVSSIVTGSPYSILLTTNAANSCAASYAISVGLETFVAADGYNITSSRAGTTLMKAAGALGNGSIPNIGTTVQGGYTNGTLAGAICNIAISQNGASPFCGY